MKKVIKYFVIAVVFVASALSIYRLVQSKKENKDENQEIKVSDDDEPPVA